MRVVIAGSGIVGLTAGLAFRALGTKVLVCEQASEVRAAGTSIGIWDNGMKVFEEFGVGPGTRAISTPIEAWFYDAAGHRFRAPGSSVEDHSFSFMPRPALNKVLADAVGERNIRLKKKVIGFEEDPGGMTVLFADGTTERADLLIGADGVYSSVRASLLSGYPAQKHEGHHVWRAVIRSGAEPAEGTILTVGHNRTRGGFSRTFGGQVVWIVSQFDSPEPTATHKEEALHRAANLNDGGWGEPLIRLIEATPEASIIHTQVMFVPPLPRWTSNRIALIGDAAHGLSPHIGAGGTLGLEDVAVLVNLVNNCGNLSAALQEYGRNRLPHYQRVHQFAFQVEHAADAQQYAQGMATFSHWMLNAEGVSHS